MHDGESPCSEHIINPDSDAPGCCRNASISTDVWAFGVLMWEMFTGQRAYQGKKTGNIIFMVTSGKDLIEMPEVAPELYTVRPPLQRLLWNSPLSLTPAVCLTDGGFILHCPRPSCQGDSLLFTCFCFVAAVDFCVCRRFSACASKPTPEDRPSFEELSGMFATAIADEENKLADK